MNWYGLPFFLAVTLINKGKGELLLIFSTPLNDTVQITETEGGGRKTEKRRADESLDCVRLLYFPGGGHLLVTGYQACLGALVRMCHEKPFPIPARAGHDTSSGL